MFTLSRKFFCFFFSICLLWLTQLKAQSDQTVTGGSQTTPVTFPTGTCTYQWTNDNPAIGLAASGTGNIPAFTALNTGATPIVAHITAVPVAGQYAYVANYGDNTVSVLSLNLPYNVVKTIQVGDRPNYVKVSPDGTKVYVADYGTNAIAVIDVASQSVVNTLLAPGLIGPQGIVISPDGNTVYVTEANNGGKVFKLNISNNTYAFVQVGGTGSDIAISPDGNTLFVLNFNSARVQLINTSDMTLTNYVPVDLMPSNAVISADGNFLYTSHNQNSLNIIDVINTNTKTVVNHFTPGNGPFGLALSPDGQLLYVGNSFDGNISVINTTTGITVKHLPAVTGMGGLSVSRDGNYLVVALNSSNNAKVFNLTNPNDQGTSLPVGTGPNSFGNFITPLPTTTCTTPSISFTMTVNSSGPPSPITATGNLSSLNTVYGTPSTAETFTIAATGLTAGVLVTPPIGFEVSTDDINFTNTVAVGGSSSIANQVIYIRLKAAANVDTYAGNIIMSSTGVSNFNLAMPTGTIVPAPLTISPIDVNKPYGLPLTAGPGYTRFGYGGIKNKESITGVTVNYTGGAVAAATTGVYANAISVSTPVGLGTFLAANYDIKYTTSTLTVTPDTLTVKPDNQNRSYGQPNPTLTFALTGFVNGEDQSVLTKLPVTATTATIASPSGQYPITVSGGAAPNYLFNYLPAVLTVNAIPGQPIVVPNTFTPNGDGINDVWNITNLNTYPQSHLQIFNRNGRLLYNTIGYTTPWNGRYNGKDLPDGTYYYVITLQPGADPVSGFVAVIR